ncbi:DUF4286 family protein [Mucilaginibacter limnophilus]|uniref:DUF4286 family protein n=1 Tax=Mucilaginibacter limnophilus TaxID=1932778 RepID=A0A3S2V2J2_9SPHI|nr:DUF4286 family protein [Mucilaginibacter limnophilus]RVU01570.1 DUF4286 family protein [Mucilaginibacter limnophilus]
MIVYNETAIVEEASAPEWLSWMQQVHIPNVMATGFFTSYQVLNVMDSPNEGVTYCVQYHARNMDDFQDFYTGHLQGLQQIQQNQFENKFVLFSTIMQTVD